MSLHLKDAPKRTLWKAMGLGYVPPELFGDGMKIIEKEAKRIRKYFPMVMNFITYMKNTWKG